MNVITPSALKTCGTKNHFLHWDRFKNQLPYQSEVKCPSDWPYNTSQNDNGAATYFLFSALLLWKLSRHPRTSSCVSTLWDYLIGWHWEYFRSGMYWLFFWLTDGIFYSIAKSIQVLCWWELCHSVQGDKLDWRHDSALKSPDDNRTWCFEIS